MCGQCVSREYYMHVKSCFYACCCLVYHGNFLLGVVLQKDGRCRSFWTYSRCYLKFKKSSNFVSETVLIWFDLIWLCSWDLIVNNVCLKNWQSLFTIFPLLNLLFVYVRYLGNNSLVGPLPAASLGSLVNLQQLWAKRVDIFFCQCNQQLGHIVCYESALH